MKLVKRAAILAGIFLAAVGIYLVIAWNQTDESETVYTLMEAPSLPVVYAEMYGTEANRLAGFTQEMGVSAARDSLVILPEDRRLSLKIHEYGAAPLSVSYDIRSLDGQRLVERSQAEDPAGDGGVSRVTLPIQNLISYGTEYLLHIQLETELHGQLHYYTRILWPETDYAEEMLALAREFSTKTFDEAEAASLVTYLETTDTADNSSLGDVTLKSSFSQITWAGLEMTPVGELRAELTELDGTMGQIRVTYQVSRQPEDGAAELYDAEDYYTMRWDEKRIYLMDFKRTTCQVFVFNRDLWLYDQDSSLAVKLFSFRSEADSTGRSDYNRHDIEILSVDDEGGVHFLVYGYMNRGLHEGSQGISICRYNPDRRGAIEEEFFIPSSESFDELRMDVGRLCYLSSQDMFYLFLDRAVFAVDLTSDEYMVVAQNLIENAYAISAAQDCLAWQDSQTPEGAQIIHLLNLETGVKQEISAPEGTLLRTLGFVQGDFVYGEAAMGDEWTLNGRNEAAPMYAIEIVDDTLENQSSYAPAEMYITNVKVEEARIHLDRLTKTGDGSYEYRDSDTIVCNTASDQTYMEGIGWYASEDRRKLYFIQLDKDIRSGRGVRIAAASHISYDQSERLELHSDGPRQETLFYAYGRGKLQGIYTELAPAVLAVYDMMGIVTDAEQRILWDRVNRRTLRSLTDAQALAFELTKRLGDGGINTVKDGMMLLDGRGLTLRETLYYISQGYPVLARAEGGAALILYGYDQYNVSVLNPDTGERYKLGLGDGTAYFESYGNDFLCGVQVK